MSNLGNYSPYNKTYKFLLYQNQAYHEKNKRTAKPCIRTNLRYEKSGHQPCFNPQGSSPLLRNSSAIEKPVTSSTNRCESLKGSLAKSMMFSSTSARVGSPDIDKQRRLIHKNQSFQKFRTKKIQMDNTKLVGRLLNTDCEVVKNQKSSKSFRNHLKYRQIRNKYDSQGKRKQNLALGKINLLCPTLKEYNQSGLGSKFLELDMSMVSQTSSPMSARKKRINFSFNEG